MNLRGIFYSLKPLIPRNIQIFLRQQFVPMKLKYHENKWPIDREANKHPESWPGWPDNKRFAFLLMHDVDHQRGHDNCLKLLEIEERAGFRSAFNFVPERYALSGEIRNEIVKRGFEIGVHGLKHDGKLFSSRKIFEERALKINQYLKDWKTDGFSSPAMLHNLEWMPALNMKYATSTFDTDPFEPQPDGVGTIFPFWVPQNAFPKGYLEVPYTLPQDFTLYIIMKERNINIWKKKLDWIAENGGMALVNTHPDYMNFSGGKPGREEYPVGYYAEFLEYVKNEYKNQYWHTSFSNMASFWSDEYLKNLKK